MAHHMVNHSAGVAPVYGAGSRVRGAGRLADPASTSGLRLSGEAASQAVPTGGKGEGWGSYWHRLGRTWRTPLVRSLVLWVLWGVSGRVGWAASWVVLPWLIWGMPEGGRNEWRVKRILWQVQRIVMLGYLGFDLLQGMGLLGTKVAWHGWMGMGCLAGGEEGACGGGTTSGWRLSGETEGSIDPAAGGRSLALSETDADGVSGAAARGKRWACGVGGRGTGARRWCARNNWRIGLGRSRK